MAHKVLGSKEIAEGQSLRRAGQTDKAIALKLGVTDRTLRRSLGTRRDARRQALVEGTLQAEWQTERYWDDALSVETIAEITGVSLDRARRISAAGQLAHRRGDRWLEWFLRRWIERSDDVGAPEHWVMLLAGLPVLAEWLTEPACMEIHQRILQYRPYLVEMELDEANRLINQSPNPSEQQNRSLDSVVGKYRKVRQGFASASRIHVSTFREHIESLSYAGLIELPDGGNIPYSALAKIAACLPLIETDPIEEVLGGQPDSRANLWQSFAQVFIHKSPEEETSI